MRTACKLLCLVLVLIVAACSSVGSGSREKSATLADLEPAVMPEENESLPKVNLDTLISTYKEVLDVTEEPELQLQVLQRLAGLEMRRGEQSLYDQQQSGQFDLAISAYKRLLENNPDHKKTDRLMYQLSKAYDLSGEVGQSMQVLNEKVVKYPGSIHYGEAQFRRAEIFFSKPDYRNAQLAYAQVIKQGKSGRHYKNALYMHGWSLFKQQRYRASLKSFVGVLDINISPDRYVGVQEMNILPDNKLENLSRGDRELTLDVLRVMSVVFSYLDGPTTVAEVFSNLGERHYMPLVYSELGKLYLKKERYRDSAETYRAFVRRYPTSDQSPVFYASLIDAYLAGAFSKEVLQEKEKYIAYYGIHSEFWQQKSADSRGYILPYLKNYLPELARYYHAKAQDMAKAKSKSGSKQAVKQNYFKAGNYYQEFIDTFPQDDQIPEIYFLLAESRFESGQLMAAIDAYEEVAYSYAYHKRGTEAGYSAIVTYDQLLKNLKEFKPVNAEEIEKWLRLKIASQLRFAEVFYDDKRADSVLVKSSEELLQLLEYEQAMQAAQRLVEKQPQAKAPLRKTAWLVIGHSQFELNRFVQSEIAYQETLRLLAVDDKSRPAVIERLAASVYKQGEFALQAGNQQAAAKEFLRVASVAPGSAISITAQYDAANAFIASANWAQAIAVLTRFRSQYPNNKLNKDIPAKLVAAYQGSGQWSKAAAELTGIYKNSKNDAVKRESLVLAAELYEKSGNIASAIDRYRTYANEYPAPLAAAMEARFKLSELYLGQNEHSKRRFWLKKIISADATAGRQRTERSRYLAAYANTVFADDDYQAFKSIPLKLPLKNTLKRKKKALKRALASYQSVADFGVQEFATLASFRIASIYEQLSKDLITSERPKGLDELAMEEYVILLEEQAFPFEEKAIAIHETNTQRSWGGVYDEWIKNSFSALKTLLPGRYAKEEGGMTIENEIF